MNKKFTLGLTLAIIFSLVVSMVAMADNVIDDVASNTGDVYLNLGDSVTINYWIVAQGQGSDGEPGCNATTASPATLSFTLDDSVTYTPTSLEFTQCRDSNDIHAQSVKFTPTSAGDFPVLVGVEDGGLGTYNTNPAKATLHVVAVNPPANNPPQISVNDASVTVDEGSQATNGGNFSDPDTDSVSLSLDQSIGVVTDNGDGTWSWSYTPADGPATAAVTITATDEHGSTATATFTLTVNNVAPTATFAVSPTSVNEGSPFTLSLTGADDASSVDVAADFTYAFDCGDGAGYGSFGTANTAPCATVDNGTLSVKGTIKDKDGGSTEYTGSVEVDNVAPIVEAPEWATPDVACRSAATLTNIGFTDPGVNDMPWNVNVAWGDGSTDLNYDTDTQGIQANQDHTYNTPGEYKATVSVTDKDEGVGSNETSVALKVKQVYNVTFLQPFDGSSPSKLITNTMKSGRVVPVKVIIFDVCAQQYVTDPTTLVSIWLSKGTATGTTNDAVEVYADAGFSNADTLHFRWTSDATRPGGGFWIYNLDSKTALNGSALAINTPYRVDVWVGPIGGEVKATDLTWALLKPVK